MDSRRSWLPSNTRQEQQSRLFTTSSKKKYCINCENCCTSLKPSRPNSFEMGYQVICTHLKVLIASYDPCDDTTTEKPLACPFLGRELNKIEEKKHSYG